MTIVFARPGESRWIEDRTGGRSNSSFAPTRRYRTINIIRAGEYTLTAADPLPDELRDALKQIHRPSGAH